MLIKYKLKQTYCKFSNKGTRHGSKDTIGYRAFLPFRCFYGVKIESFLTEIWPKMCFFFIQGPTQKNRGCLYWGGVFIGEFMVYLQCSKGYW